MNGTYGPKLLVLYKATVQYKMLYLKLWMVQSIYVYVRTYVRITVESTEYNVRILGHIFSQQSCLKCANMKLRVSFINIISLQLLLQLYYIIYIPHLVTFSLQNNSRISFDELPFFCFTET